MSFNKFPLHPSLTIALERAGYSCANAINETLITRCLESKDLYVSAPIGSGKATSCLIYVLNQLLQEKPETAQSNQRTKSPHAIFLAPSRGQVHHLIRTANELCQHLPSEISVQHCHNPYHCFESTQPIAGDILVTTPENLVDCIKEELLSTEQVKTIVYKNADQLLDAGYWSELDIIYRKLPKDHQSIILASKEQENDLTEISSLFQKNAIQAHFHEEKHKFLNERIHLADNFEHKKALLTFLLQDGEVRTAFVITNTSACAKRLSHFLQENDLPNKLVLWDNAAQVAQQAEEEEKEHIPAIYIGTGGALRSLNKQIASHLIHFNFPPAAEAYLAQLDYLSDKTRNPVVISLVDRFEKKRLHQLESTSGKTLLHGVIPGLEPKQHQKPRKSRGQRSKKDHDVRQKQAHQTEYSGFMRSNTRRTQKSPSSSDGTDKVAPSPPPKKSLKKKSPNPNTGSHQKKSRPNAGEKQFTASSQQLYTSDQHYDLQFQTSYSNEKPKNTPVIKVQKKVKLQKKNDGNQVERSSISRIVGKLRLSTRK